MLGLIPTTSPFKALQLFPMEVNLESSSNSRAIARQWCLDENISEIGVEGRTLSNEMT